MASPPERPSVGTRSPTVQPVEKHTGKMSFCKINEQPVLGARCVWAGQPCTWDSAVHCLQRGWAQRGFQRRVRASGPWCPGWLCLSHAGTEFLLSFPLPSRAKPVDKGNPWFPLEGWTEQWQATARGVQSLCVCVCVAEPLYGLVSPELHPAEHCDLRGFPVIWGVFFSLVFARTLPSWKCGRSGLCMNSCSRTRPGAGISSGNPPTPWKIQHMHMDILIKEKILIFLTV